MYQTIVMLTNCCIAIKIYDLSMVNVLQTLLLSFKIILILEAF